MSIEVPAEKAQVRDFWEAKPCGSVHADAPEGTREYFDQVERQRYEVEPFIPRHARFSEALGRDVLEIGVGLGTDFVRFARAGGRLTGVDLTEHSVELVRRRLELEGLAAELRVADAERLPFEDRRFDITYSWGVLHHTPDPVRAMREAVRVTRPGGRVCVMVYARRSWLAYGLWARHALLNGRPTRSLRDVLAHHMESPGTCGFTPAELRGIFPDLESRTIRHVGTVYDRRVAGPLVSATGRGLGWFLVVTGTRAAGA